MSEKNLNPQDVTRITITLEKNLNDSLDKEAAALQISKSSLIRMAVIYYMNTNPLKNEREDEGDV